MSTSSNAFSYDGVSAVAVVDIGSGRIRGGWAGEDAPRCELPNVWHAKPRENLNGAYSAEGLEPKAVYPVERGQVQDWDGLEALLQDVLDRVSQPQSPQPYPLLLSRPMFSARSEDLGFAQLVLEKFDAPSLCLARQPILALHGISQSSGVVLDCGEGLTQIVPIFEGFVIEHAVRRMHLAGQDVTLELQRALSMRQPNPVYVSIETAREIKEKYCFVDQRSTPKPDDSMSRSHTTSSGDVITVGAERWKCPEILFQPSLGGLEGGGLAQQLNTAIASCAVDVRGQLCDKIFMAGGTTLTPGICQRLVKELSALVPHKQVKVVASPGRHLCSWRGGSVLGSLSTFPNLCITKQEFQEEGERIFQKKFQ
ncbi:hypothetical protein C0Q70_05607 [Pomacea canaliculata]|uniref:Actin, cytoplasmic n=1 Tax=Pomacea canaliculata TaxID=400727 RepID=A0A2T7PLM9_POMCA|nr:actin-3-like [Pomacea canaliculata]XP_025085801.1 actin-3-like [Pomacea canaliculata]PVD34336.1 hypothetical protein C0Q70_05607 [Pomacea canaliculata]